MIVGRTPASALYRTIQSQPAVLRDVFDRCARDVDAAAALLGDARRVYLSGTGTSSHAAIVGAHMLRLMGVDAYATTNFDQATYPRPLGADDGLIAISHRGSKQYGRAVIDAALANGVRVVGITGQGSPMSGPAIVVHTAPQEVSSTHTASYTANLAALALLALRLGIQRGADVANLQAELDGLPAAMEQVLRNESPLWTMAEILAARGRMLLIGAGPNAATAREGALKVKESSYLVAEGAELETALHGLLQAVEQGDVAVVIAAHGPALERTASAIKALSIIGARLLVIADERVVATLPVLDERDAAPTVISFPPVPEALSPLLAVLPLQLLAAFTADIAGTDADSFRAEDPVYDRASKSYTL